MSASWAYRAAHADGPIAMTSSESSHVIPASRLARVMGVLSKWSAGDGRFTTSRECTRVPMTVTATFAVCMLDARHGRTEHSHVAKLGVRQAALLHKRLLHQDPALDGQRADRTLGRGGSRQHMP